MSRPSSCKGAEKPGYSRRMFRTFTGPCCAEGFAELMRAKFPESECSAGTEDIYWTVEAENAFHMHLTKAENMARAIGLRSWRTFPVEDLGILEGGA